MGYDEGETGKAPSVSIIGMILHRIAKWTHYGLFGCVSRTIPERCEILTTDQKLPIAASLSPEQTTVKKPQMSLLGHSV